jgi:hypothetical protein
MRVRDRLIHPVIDRAVGLSRIWLAGCGALDAYSMIEAPAIAPSVKRVQFAQELAGNFPFLSAKLDRSFTRREYIVAFSRIFLSF